MTKYSTAQITPEINQFGDNLVPRLAGPDIVHLGESVKASLLFAYSWLLQLPPRHLSQRRISFCVTLDHPS